MVSKSPKPVPSGVTDAATVARWKGSGLLYDQRLQQVALDLLDGEVGSQVPRMSGGSPTKASSSGGTAATIGCYSPEGNVSGGYLLGYEGIEYCHLTQVEATSISRLRE